MTLLKNSFRLCWRLWFYGWILFTILLALPLLLIVISFKKLYPVFFKIAVAWGKTILFVMGFRPVISGNKHLDPAKSYIFIANHASLIDGMLMLAIVKNPAVFVGKKELEKIPIFGYIFKKTSILVNRNDPESRKQVYASVEEKINLGLSIIIFPEGLVPPENIVLAEFKNGAFYMAIEHQIPIVPITFYDVKKRFSWTFFSGWPGKLRVKIHPSIETKGLVLGQMEHIKQQAFQTIYSELTKDQQHFQNLTKK
ncbi:1-acyl-sn-glycerol-3-phosphate acyltransferase [Flavobacteriaceae bacterium F08102]|nr:1-acyl-sn-glycerol-3-phosphate acyltransferase [Flavobacteriaceae bacterium F08102]